MGHHGARREAGAASDALEGRVDLSSLQRVAADQSELRRACASYERGAHSFHLLRKRGHVYDQVANQRKVVEGADGDLLRAEGG